MTFPLVPEIKQRHLGFSESERFSLLVRCEVKITYRAFGRSRFLIVGKNGLADQFRPQKCKMFSYVLIFS